MLTEQFVREVLESNRSENNITAISKQVYIVLIVTPGTSPTNVAHVLV